MIIISIVIVVLFVAFAVGGILISNIIERKPTPSKSQNPSHNEHIDAMLTETDSFLQSLADRYKIIENPYVRLDFHVYIYQFFALAIENSPKCPMASIPDYHYFYLNALYKHALTKYGFSQQYTKTFIKKRAHTYKLALASQKDGPLYSKLQQTLRNYIIEDAYGKDASYLEQVLAQSTADRFAMGGGNHEEHLYLFLCQYQ